MIRILGVVLVTAAALAANAVAVRQGVAPDLLTPGPEQVVQAFLTALASSRYELAREHLAEDARRRLPADALKAADAAWQRRWGRYRFRLGGHEQRQDGRAVYVAALETRRAGSQSLRFSLERDPESRLWIAWFNP